MTLNVNGINERKQRENLFQFLLNQNAQIYFITETHARKENIKAFKDEWLDLGGENAFFEPTNKKGSSGVAILFGKNFNPQTSNINKMVPGKAFSIDANIHNINHTLLVTYAPNKPAKRKIFFNEIDEKCHTTEKILWGGDFNCVENITLDRSSDSRESIHKEGALQIKKIKDTHFLSDPFREKNPNLFEYTFTARNTILRIGSRARLDRFYIPESYSKQSQTTFLHNIPNTDHDCVITTIKIKQKHEKGKPYCKFNVKL